MKWFLRLALAAILLLAIPAAQVTALRWWNPPFTGTQVQRAVESLSEGKGWPKVRQDWLPLERFPKSFVKCVLVAEDWRFFKHQGIDWKEVEAARKRSRETGKPLRGVSTITMQCARTVFLWQGRSWPRKVLEAGYTLLMEGLLEKERILELYLNTAEWGSGIYGAQAAALAYFGKPLAKLDRRQFAALAAMLPAPRTWDPRKPSPRLRARTDMILSRSRIATFPLD